MSVGAEKEHNRTRSYFGKQPTKAKMFCVKMPIHMANRLLEWAKREGVSPQEILRKLLETALDEKVLEKKG